MQNSTKNVFLERYKQANAAAQGMYKQIEGKKKWFGKKRKINKTYIKKK